FLSGRTDARQRRRLRRSRRRPRRGLDPRLYEGLRRRRGAAAPRPPLLPQQLRGRERAHQPRRRRRPHPAPPNPLPPPTPPRPPPCERLQAAAGETPAVASLTERFVPVVRDGGDTTLETRYQAVRMPTTLILDPWGNEIFRVTGYLERDKMARVLQAIPADFA